MRAHNTLRIALTHSPLLRRPAVLVMLLAALLVFAFQGTRGIWDPDEGRFTNVALQMLQTGDFVSLYRHHESLHFTKPPVTYWAIAASVSVFGWNEWAARLPNALAFLAVVALLLRIGRHFSPQRPWLPALIYATMPVPLLAAHVVTTDTPLAFATTLALACYAIARFEARPGFIVGMWAAFGLAFMTKGPPGLLGLAAVVVFHFSRKGGLHKGGLHLFPPLGLIAFALIGFTWYALVISRHEGLLAYFLYDEVFERVATDIHHRNPQWWGGFYVYGLTLGLGTLPWWPWAVAAARRVGLRWRNADEPTRLLLVWIGVSLLIFMLSRSRLALYVLPLFAPLALLFGRALQHMAWRWTRMTALALFAAGVVGLKALLASMPHWAHLLPAAQAARLPLHKNARQWADDLRVVVPFAPTEVVFVNDMARYGLHLYLRAQIEKIDFDGDLARKPVSDAPFDDTVYDDLREPGVSGRVFVMRPWAQQRFEVMARDAGWQPAYLGPVQDHVVYRLSRPPTQATEAR